MKSQTPAELYWQTFATVCIRRLWSLRADPLAKTSLRGWIRTLRQTRVAIGGGS